MEFFFSLLYLEFPFSNYPHGCLPHWINSPFKCHFIWPFPQCLHAIPLPCFVFLHLLCPEGMTFICHPILYLYPLPHDFVISQSDTGFGYMTYFGILADMMHTDTWKSLCLFLFDCYSSAISVNTCYRVRFVARVWIILAIPSHSIPDQPTDGWFLAIWTNSVETRRAEQPSRNEMTHRHRGNKCLLFLRTQYWSALLCCLIMTKNSSHIPLWCITFKKNFTPE